MSTNLATISGATMGTRYAAMFPETAVVNTFALQANLHHAVTRVDQQMSPWIPSSFLNQFNAAPLDHWMEVPKETAVVMNTALDIERKSGGAFSMSVGPQVNHFGFGPHLRGEGVPPKMGVTAGEAICIEGAYIKKTAPIEIDLCGIAKGYGVDALAETMIAHGVMNFMVSIDGELRSQGVPGPDDFWQVALEQPDVERRRAAKVIPCLNVALATSGSYRNFDEVGDMVSHTIDPRTGDALPFAEQSVTVAARKCCEADAWATAFLVMGATKAEGLAEEYGLELLVAKG